MHELISDNVARMLQARVNQGIVINDESLGLLEYWRWVKQPIKQALAITDFQYVFLPDYPEIIIGKFDGFNQPIGQGYVYGSNRILYHGKHGECNQNGIAKIYLVADRLSYKFIEKCWKRRV